MSNYGATAVGTPSGFFPDLWENSTSHSFGGKLNVSSTPTFRLGISNASKNRVRYEDGQPF